MVRKRRMVRSFEDRPVDPDLVDQLLRNGMRGPSAGFSQATAFLVFDGKDEVTRFWDVVDPQRQGWQSWPDMWNAPLVIVPCSQKKVMLDRYSLPDKGWTDRSESRWHVPYWDIDTAMAAMLVLLTVVELGLGALFFGTHRTKELKEAFGVPDHVNPIGAIAIGWPKPKDRPSGSLKIVGRRPAEDLIHRGHWRDEGDPQVR